MAGRPKRGQIILKVSVEACQWSWKIVRDLKDSNRSPPGRFLTVFNVFNTRKKLNPPNYINWKRQIKYMFSCLLWFFVVTHICTIPSIQYIYYAKYMCIVHAVQLIEQEPKNHEKSFQMFNIWTKSFLRLAIANQWTILWKAAGFIVKYIISLRAKLKTSTPN